MFSINEWYKSKCVNHTTPVKVIDSELGLAANGKPKYLKFTLAGDVNAQTSEGLAELALQQKAEVKVARDGTELPEGTVFSRRAVTTGVNIAHLLLSLAHPMKVQDEEEEKEEKTTEQIAKEEEARILAEMEAEEANNRLSGSNTELPAVPGKPSV